MSISISSPSASSTDPKAGFANGLSAWISQVSSGSAPSGLQSAFDKLALDLQGANGTSGATSGGTTTGSSTQATLQQLLTQLQQNLGYGAASSSAALGNFVSTKV